MLTLGAVALLFIYEIVTLRRIFRFFAERITHSGNKRLKRALFLSARPTFSIQPVGNTMTGKELKINVITKHSPRWRTVV